jgi:hypothetical protein
MPSSGSALGIEEREAHASTHILARPLTVCAPATSPGMSASTSGCPPGIGGGTTPSCGVRVVKA